MAGEDGRIVHAELQIGDGVVTIGAASADPDWASPRSLQRKVTQGIYIYVDDVDDHHAQASEEGATILTPPADRPFGDRVYVAADLEGHQWTFAQRMSKTSKK